MIAGYVDAYGYLNFTTYVSFMSGNTTQTGFLTAQGNFRAASYGFLAIASFVGGIFTGSWLTYPGTHNAQRLRFVVVAVLLSISVILRLPGWPVGAGCIAILAAAMGFMNNSIPRIGAQSVNLTFVTGTLNRMGTHLALAARGAPLEDAQGPWDTHRRRALLMFGVWVGFLTGALLGGEATSRFGMWMLMVPILTLLALAVAGSPTRRS